MINKSNLAAKDWQVSWNEINRSNMWSITHREAGDVSCRNIHNCMTYVTLQLWGLFVVKLLRCVSYHKVVTPTFLKLLLVVVLKRNAQ